MSASATLQGGHNNGQYIRQVPRTQATGLKFSIADYKLPQFT